MSVKRDGPHRVTVLPGGGPLARARWPPSDVIFVRECASVFCRRALRSIASQSNDAISTSVNVGVGAHPAPTGRASSSGRHASSGFMRPRSNWPGAVLRRASSGLHEEIERNLCQLMHQRMLCPSTADRLWQIQDPRHAGCTSGNVRACCRFAVERATVLPVRAQVDSRSYPL